MAYKKSRPNGAREQKLKKRYGLTEEAYNKILAEQEGKCGICHRYRRLSVDHHAYADAVMNITVFYFLPTILLLCIVGTLAGLIGLACSLLRNR